MAKTAVAYCLHDDRRFLAESLASFAGAGDAFAFVNDTPWAGSPGDWRAAAAAARGAGATVVEGSWPAEVLHRQGALAWLRERGYTHALLPEPDEIVESALVDSLLKVAQARLAERVHVEALEYWKGPDHVVRTREPLRPTLMVEIAAVYRHDLLGLDGRLFGGGRGLLLPADHGTLHRLAFVGPDARMRRRLETCSDLGRPMPGWWGRVWKAWDDDPLLGDLHPTHPRLFAFAERIPVPEALRGIPLPTPSAPEAFPNREHLPISAVVVVGDEPEGLTALLRGLAERPGLVAETIVVAGSARPETLWSVRNVPGATHRLEAVGRAAARTAGISRARSPLVLLVDAGTILPAVSLEAMAESLLASETIAAVGPLSNAGGPGQRIEPPVTSLDNLGLFAESIAGRSVEDAEAESLDAGCLLVRRSALVEMGVLDGTSGDSEEELFRNFRRSGYRLLLCARGYAHVRDY